MVLYYIYTYIIHSSTHTLGVESCEYWRATALRACFYTQMKISSWIRNKRNGKDDATKTNPVSMSYRDKLHRPNCNEEFSDWPNGLLAIGTFGHSNFKHCQDYPEDLGVGMHISNTLDSSPPGEPGKRSPPVEKILDCLREADEKETDDDDDDDESSSSERQRSDASIVQMGSGKDVQTDKKKRGIRKKSLSFLLKKVLLCRGGFMPATPIVRDPKLDNSRMEKILKAMLNKRIYPQRPNPNTTSRKYLDMPKTESDNEDYEEESNRSKWVKTDSEYIVLEI